MKLINKIHIIQSLIISLLIASVFGIKASYSFILGSIVILSNINAFSLLLGSENKEISVAWSSFIIVSKYALLIAIIYFLISSEYFLSEFVASGFVSLLISVVLFAIINNSKKVEHGTL